jgi:signal transduction histidine kinase
MKPMVVRMGCLKNKDNNFNCVQCKDIYPFIYHEITTPLSVLLLSLYKLEELDSDRKLVNICKQSVDKTTNILKAFLVEESIAESRTNIKKAIKAFFKLYNRKCTFEVIVSANAELPITQDVFAIILKNLIKNTIEHSAQKRPRIRMSFEATKQSLFFYYSDNGKGINPDDQSSVFKRRYSRNPGDSRGFGLMLINHLITKSGGSIKCKSDGSSFTEFTIEYPIA